MDYARTVGSKLSFKGDSKTKKKKKKKKRKKKRNKHDSDEGAGGVAGYVPMKKLGHGRFITSGTSVMGQGETRFLEELTAGDCIIVQHPTSLADETRIVTMVLSNMSISISSPFSTDLISPSRYHYIKAPPKEIDHKEEAAKKKRRKVDEEKTAFGTYAAKTADGGQQMTYRIKKKGLGMSYHLITERVGKLSREQLLDKRSKKKHDRLCSM